MIIKLIETVYAFLWGDLFTIPVMGSSIGISLMLLLLIPAGIYFTIRTRILPIRLFPDMIRALKEKKETPDSLSSLQTLIISTATRVGMGNLVGVVAAVSLGGAGAVFWMWITALLGASTAFVEAVLAQKYKEPDLLYGGYHGGPAYYIHHFVEEKRNKNATSTASADTFSSDAFSANASSTCTANDRNCKRSILACLFAISGLICWCGISQVISNSVSSAFANAFQIPPVLTTVILVVLAAVIVLQKNATVKILDIMVPVMAVGFFLLTVFIILINLPKLPSVFVRIFTEAFGMRQAVSGGFGAILMNGVKRGLFSNEAGSGSAPCAAAAAQSKDPVQTGLTQSLGVLIDTIVICSCTAMIMLLAPEEITAGLTGMDLLQTAMHYHLGSAGVIFIAVTLALFSFSTFIGILFYARSNVAYLFGNRWCYQTAYKVLALVMLFIGGLQQYTVVWDLGDVGIGLMTLFNIAVLYPMSKEALELLKQYEKKKYSK